MIQVVTLNIEVNLNMERVKSLIGISKSTTPIVYSYLIFYTAIGREIKAIKQDMHNNKQLVVNISWKKH